MPQPGDTKQVNGQWGRFDGTGWVPIPPPADAGGQSTLYQSPASAFTGELARTGGVALKGLLHSPVDALKGILGIPGQVIKGYTQDIPALLRDPSLLKEAPAAAVQGVRDLGNDPEAAGSLLGQLLIGKAAPAAIRAANPRLTQLGRSAAGYAGSALETAGKVTKPVRGHAVMGSIMTGNVPGAVAAAVGPDLMAATGRGLSKFAASEPKGAPMAPPPGLGLGYDQTFSGVRKGSLADDLEPPPTRPASVSGLYDEFMQQERPASYEWPEAGGTYAQNAEGSDVLVKPSKRVLDPEAQATVLKNAAYDRGINGFWNEPEAQARRQAAIAAIRNLESFRDLPR